VVFPDPVSLPSVEIERIKSETLKSVDRQKQSSTFNLIMLIWAHLPVDLWLFIVPEDQRVSE
jgi:hypothetical protein